MADNICKNKSLRKSLLLLEALIETPSMGITELSQRFGLNKSNVHDIISTFRTMGYVQQNKETLKYSLGLRLLQFSRAAAAFMYDQARMHQHLQDIAVESGEAAFFGVCDGCYVVYLEVAYPSSRQLSPSIHGMRAPAYCTGLGKAILSALPEEEWSQHIPSVLKPKTDHTITDPEALFSDLRSAQRHGYAIDHMEYEFGIKSVAVPCYGGTSKQLGALCVSGPSLRFSDRAIETYAHILLEKTSLLSAAL